MLLLRDIKAQIGSGIPFAARREPEKRGLLASLVKTLLRMMGPATGSGATSAGCDIVHQTACGLLHILEVTQEAGAHEEAAALAEGRAGRKADAGLVDDVDGPPAGHRWTPSILRKA